MAVVVVDMAAGVGVAVVGVNMAKLAWTVVERLHERVMVIAVVVVFTPGLRPDRVGGPIEAFSPLSWVPSLIVKMRDLSPSLHWPTTATAHFRGRSLAALPSPTFAQSAHLAVISHVYALSHYSHSLSSPCSRTEKASRAPEVRAPIQLAPFFSTMKFPLRQAGTP